jgi:hypothetical protein
VDSSSRGDSSRGDAAGVASRDAATKLLIPGKLPRADEGGDGNTKLLEPGKLLRAEEGADGGGGGGRGDEGGDEPRDEGGDELRGDEGGEDTIVCSASLNALRIPGY